MTEDKIGMYASETRHQIYESERQWEGFWQINKATDMSLNDSDKDFDKYLWKKLFPCIAVAFEA